MSEITHRLSAALEDRYKVGEQVGQGGMATVFLAEDIRHQRRVAIKVLRPELAAVIGAERFLKEIQVTANLQHPHILPLHDSGEADSFLYYVMPYVEGESLRELLDREKQLGIEEAVDIIQTIAGAVDYAHRQGVIHRDIKPENILMHDGQALVADFGIALAVSSASDTRLTETGLSLGTPHYMSPEQAMGDRALDARSDVYSLGAMLYEMLAGDPPYQGSTAQAIIAKVITEKAPPVTVARDTVPANVSAAIQKALNKLPADRFHTAAEFADALGNTAFQISGATDFTQVTTAATSNSEKKKLLKPVLLGVLLIALGVAGGWLGKPSPVPTVERYILPEWSLAENGIDISPDGSIIVAGITDGPASRLAYRNASAIDAVFFGGAEIRFNPTFSPDGDEVVYSTPQALRRMSLAGTPPVTILDLGFIPRVGTDWGSDGFIYFTTNPGGRLGRVPASGGDPEVVATHSAGAGMVSFIVWPDLLPNEKSVIVTVTGGSTDADAMIGVVDLESGDLRTLMAGMMGRYSETGHLLYVSSDGNLFAVPFDQDKLEVIGAPVGVAGNIYMPGFAAAGYAISRSGDLVYQVNDSAAVGRSLVIVDREGRATRLPFPNDHYNDVNLSPDGSRIAFEIAQPGADGGDIYVARLDDSLSTRLTFQGINSYPAWNADGTMVGFSRFIDSDRDLFWKPADGSRSAERIFDREGTQFEIAFSPDGQWVGYREGNASVTDELNVGYAPLTGGEFRNFSAEVGVRERSPAFSPDGKWLAYVSNTSGYNQIYVRAFPPGESGAVRQISADGGTGPIWSRDGTALYYTSAGGLVEAKLETGRTVNVRARTVLFQTNDFLVNPWHPRYDVLPDGNFVMISLGGSQGSLTTVLVRNWAEEMK